MARPAETRQTDPGLIDSATYLAEQMHNVPVLIVPCVESPGGPGVGPDVYASILPQLQGILDRNGGKACTV